MSPSTRNVDNINPVIESATTALFDWANCASLAPSGKKARARTASRLLRARRKGCCTRGLITHSMIRGMIVGHEGGMIVALAFTTQLARPNVESGSCAASCCTKCGTGQREGSCSMSMWRFRKARTLLSCKDALSTPRSGAKLFSALHPRTRLSQRPIINY